MENSLRCLVYCVLIDCLIRIKIKRLNCKYVYILIYVIGC